MDQAVHAVEVDERAEVDDVGDLTVDDVARIESVEDRLTHLLALVLEDSAAREDDVVARPVELYHLAAELLARELFEILHPANVDERRRQESAHPEIEDETALDDLDHATVDRLAALRCRFDRLPGELEAGALLGQDQTPFGVFLLHHERVDLLAQGDLVGRVDRAPDRELGDRDHTLGFVADVDEHLVLVDAHDRAVDDLPLVDRRERRVVVRNQLSVGAGDPDAVLEDGNFHSGHWGALGCRVGHGRAGSIATNGRFFRPPHPGYRSTWRPPSCRRRPPPRPAAGRAGMRRPSPLARAP